MENKPLKDELYISVDIESSGHILGIYNMLSIGACAVDATPNKIGFYRELKPINDNYIWEALQVSGFDMFSLKEIGVDPKIAMEVFEDWIERNCQHKYYRPVFVGFNVTFGWQFVNYYFNYFLDYNPFGILVVLVIKVGLFFGII